MKIYEIKVKQNLTSNIENVFKFFSKPTNLAKITPKRLGFRIITPLPLEMKSGTIIDYYIKIFSFPIRWRTIITNYEYPSQFIDQQLKGPYSFWHHTHTFEETENGTLIKDQIRYVVPFGFLGRILNYLWIKRDLKNIFEYRKEKIKQLIK